MLGRTTRRDHRLAAERARLTLEAGRLFFEANPQPMWVYDRESLRFLEVNQAAVEHYGYSREEFLAMGLADIRPPADHDRLVAAVAAHSSGLLRSAGWRHLHKDGRLMDVEITSHPLTYAGCDAVLVSISDVTERLALERQLRDQALYDGLTGLPNQTLFEDRVQQALLRSTHGAVAVLILDIDDFKTVNDIHDRRVGDQILLDVAMRLRTVTRDADTVARLGGDEFAIVLEDATRPSCEAAVVRVREQFSQAFAVDTSPLELSCSIGIAYTPLVAPRGEELLRCARAASLHAKSEGTGRHAWYEHSLHGQTVGRMGLANDMRGILSREELHLEFQPIVSLPDGRIRGAEALLRWHHPTRGLVSPTDFIPVAERTGLIVPIGIWVLRASCEEALTWPRSEDLSISINVSSRQLREPGFSDDVERILHETELDPQRVVLEVTESVLVDDVVGAQLRLAQLRSLGVRIALDDFGAGYSSLGYLRSLPLDVVKIDRMFVSSLSDQDERRSLILGVIRLLQTLHVQTVAEGIETLEQLEYMTAMGVDRAQGFYFARPMPARALRERFAVPAYAGAVSAYAG